MKCQKCQQQVFLPFRCPYCGDYFCSEHRLPENHNCPRKEEAMQTRKEAQTTSVQRRQPYEHTINYIPVETKRKRIQFSAKEIQHLAVATVLIIGIGLSWLLSTDSYETLQEPLQLGLFTTFLTASFLIHEIAHKVTAQRAGLWAEFRLTLIGALLTLVSIISPLFKIISPGAVMIAGLADRKSIGKISIAGPATNIALSATFFLIAYFIPSNGLAFLLVASFNAWIALFNLIPFSILDGFKIFTWDKKIWALAFIASLTLTLFSYWIIM